MKKITVTKENFTRDIVGAEGSPCWSDTLVVTGASIDKNGYFLALRDLEGSVKCQLVAKDLNVLLYQLNNFYGFNIEIKKELTPIKTSKELYEAMSLILPDQACRHWRLVPTNDGLIVTLGNDIVDLEQYGYKLVF